MELEGLNQAQLAAVQHDIGPALVVAGAGTGKTAVITRRIAYLIRTGKADPGQILALTFTEKAAREMAERLYDLIGWRSFQVAVLTFHGFGAELLGRYASHIGRSISGGLLNDMQKALLMQQHFGEVQLSYYGPQSNIFEFLEGVVRYIGTLQNSGIGPQQYRAYAEKVKVDPRGMHPKDVAEQLDLAALYELYESIKAQTGTYDYNDQLEIPLRILQQMPNLAERLHKQYRYVLVDEYQDTNAVQDQLLRSFVPPDGNLFVVGDDDQAIYGFRGAQIDNILSFVDHFQGVKPLVLVQNYRSGQQVLDASYRLIQHNNPERLEAKLGLDKRLQAATETTSSVEFAPYANGGDEQEGVLQAIEAQLKSGASPRSIGVLATSHATLKPIARGLRSRDLPFALSTNVNIFEQPELNQLWYLLGWLGYQADDQAIGHILLGPFVGWSAETYRALVKRSRNEHEPLEDLLRGATDDPAAAQLVVGLDAWREWARELPVSKLAYKLVFETGVSDRLIARATASSRIVRVFEDLHRLLSQMQDYESVAIDSTLTGYLAAFPKPPSLEVNEPLGEEEGVQLLTVHASKGLEFDTVYLINATQRAWSAGSNRMGEREIPEELRAAKLLPPEHELRRLMYVAVTRTKQRLIISAATKTAGGTRQTASPFVAELLGDISFRQEIVVNGTKLSETLNKMQRFLPLSEENNQQPLPFEDTDGWLTLGVNDLKSYDFCPYDFYLEKVLRIVQPFGPQLAFGTAVHRAIQRYFDAQLRGEAASEADIRANLDESWSDLGYETAELAEQAKQLAHATLHTFFARQSAGTEHIKGSELPITLEIPEAKLRLKGRIDAFFETPDGIELRDFKTGRTKTDPDKLAKEAKSNFQLRSYALAFQEMTGKVPSTVTLDYVVTDTVGRAGLTPAIMKNHRTKLVDLAARIRSRDFEPRNTGSHLCAAVRYYGTEDELDDLKGLNP